MEELPWDETKQELRRLIAGLMPVPEWCTCKKEGIRLNWPNWGINICIRPSDTEDPRLAYVLEMQQLDHFLSGECLPVDMASHFHTTIVPWLRDHNVSYISGPLRESWLNVEQRLKKIQSSLSPAPLVFQHDGGLIWEWHDGRLMIVRIFAPDDEEPEVLIVLHNLTQNDSPTIECPVDETLVRFETVVVPWLIKYGILLE